MKHSRGCECVCERQSVCSCDSMCVSVLLSLCTPTRTQVECTPLMLAVRFGHLECARLLVAAGADAEATHEARLDFFENQNQRSETESE